jgi:hypothetical protein
MPSATRVLRNTMAQVALRRPAERTKALRDSIAELLSMDEPRKRFAGMMSGLDIHYDLGEGHPLLGRRMTDLDLVTPNGQLRVFTLLHDARPVLLNLGEPGCFDITPWADRVQSIDAKYVGEWELPALGAVTAPTAVSIRRRSPPCVADQGAGGCQQWQRDGINSATGAFSGVARVQFRHPAGAGGTGWCSSSGICSPDRTRWSAETFSPAPPGMLPWS